MRLQDLTLILQIELNRRSSNSAPTTITYDLVESFSWIGSENPHERFPCKPSTRPLANGNTQ
jgi:hypothetical protein